MSLSQEKQERVIQDFINTPQKSTEYHKDRGFWKAVLVSDIEDILEENNFVPCEECRKWHLENVMYYDFGKYYCANCGHLIKAKDALLKFDDFKNEPYDLLLNLDWHLKNDTYLSILVNGFSQSQLAKAVVDKLGKTLKDQEKAQWLEKECEAKGRALELYLLNNLKIEEGKAKEQANQSKQT